MLKNRITKIAQLEHSQVKVELYTKYLSTYLNILHRVPEIDHVIIFDLLCGEGRYTNQCLGSGCAAAEVIKRHCLSNIRCKRIDLYLNDNGISEIELGKTKVQRNKELITSFNLQENVKVHYAESEYSEILPVAISKLDVLKPNERALVFIDPYGYKEIHIEQLKKILNNKKTELLLFLPASFIYRFAGSSFDKDFPGAEAVRQLLKSIFLQEIPEFTSCCDFITKIKDGIKTVVNTSFASSFTIQRDEKNTFCLLFFTNNERGYEKMLETKWAMDEERGEGFRLNNAQTNLFTSAQVDNFEAKILKFIADAKSRTNFELKAFGLANEYLPKHVLAELKQLLDDGRIEVKEYDGTPARAFYLNDNQRTVFISKKE
jgi:three-Cys-motif partner protein